MIISAKVLLLCLLPIFLLASFAEAAPTSPAAANTYELAISFDLGAHRLTGTARIPLPPDRVLHLAIEQLDITGIVITTRSGESYEMRPPEGPMLTVPADHRKRHLLISYTRTITSGTDNLLGEEAIVLLDNWYPLPDHRMAYHLSATLPPKFTAVTESDTFPLARTGNTVSADFSGMLDSLHFAAARYALDKLKVRKDLFVFTLFFPEDRDLAQGYLEAARAYILRYEKRSAPFPTAITLLSTIGCPPAWGCRPSPSLAR